MSQRFFTVSLMVCAFVVLVVAPACAYREARTPVAGKVVAERKTPLYKTYTPERSECETAAKPRNNVHDYGDVEIFPHREQPRDTKDQGEALSEQDLLTEPKRERPSRTLTRQNLVDLATAGVSESNIRLLIQRSWVELDLDSDTMIDLKQLGLSDELLEALILRLDEQKALYGNVQHAENEDAGKRDREQLRRSLAQDLEALEQKLCDLSEPGTDSERYVGEVWYVDVSRGWAYINLGQRDEIEAGTSFNVERAGAAENNVSVGMLTVREVLGDYMSWCEISLLHDEDDPVQVGDRLVAHDKETRTADTEGAAWVNIPGIDPSRYDPRHFNYFRNSDGLVVTQYTFDELSKQEREEFAPWCPIDDETQNH